MLRIFNNIENDLLHALQETITLPDRAEFCVGYSNLRGWRQIDSFIDRRPEGDGHWCGILVSIQNLPTDDLRIAMNLRKHYGFTD